MYGWRGRIGLLLPTGNTTNEPEFWKMAPEGVTIHTNRVYLKDVTRESLLEMMGNLEKSAKDLSQCQVDVMAFGCTSGSFAGGPNYDKKCLEVIEAAAQVPSTTTSTAVLNALKTVKAKKLAVATPYIKDINRIEKEFLEAAGFEVTEIKGLDNVELYEIMSNRPETAYRLAKKVNNDKADTIFISCTGFRTVEILKKLEDDLQKPVINSNQATFWQCLKMMSIKSDLTQFGSLFTHL